jgi:Extensin-like protein C-terminus
VARPKGWIVLALLAALGAPSGAAPTEEPAKPALAPAPAPEKAPAAPAPAKPAKAAKAKAAKAKAKAAKAAKARPASVAAKPKQQQKKKKRSKAKSPYFTAPADATTSPAFRYAALSQVDCEAELKQRGIGFQRETARGVLAPVRLTGPIQGVLFRTDLNDQARATSPWEIADCRLVLSLDDFASILKAHDIVEVRHFSIFRPPPKSWPEDKLGARHNGALALDAGRFVGKDGRVLDVDKHFHGAIGAKTCGPGAAPRPRAAEATELRAILCETADRRLFNVVLTPNYNRPHKNHFHLELTEGVRWFLVH